MNRIKIFLLILIIGVLSIVFIQNREPTALKFLCGYGSSYCLYRSSNLPLAVWIALFTLIGMLVNLLGQLLNRYSYSNSNRRQYSDPELYPKDRWRGEPTVEPSTYTKIEEPMTKDNSDTTSYEVRQEPQNVERSGSTYSYKYREAGDRQASDRNNSRKSIDPDVIPIDKEQDDEDWI